MIRRNQNTDQHSSQGDGPTAKQPLKEKALVCGRPHDIDPARRKMLVDIAEANYTMRRQWGVPRTVAVAFSTVMAPKCRGNLPLVSFSASSTADALLSLAKKHSVCGLNFANGKTVGGGYKRGAVAQEEDLCRRIPALYTTLNNAARAGNYPFGPSTCTSVANPERYSDVLFTPNLVIARAGEEQGYQLLPPDEQRLVSIITAAAPNQNFAKEVWDDNLVYNTVKAMFLVPQIQNPALDTLVLGAWGCGAFGGDPWQISAMFAHALAQDKLGHYYREVHFAIPGYKGGEVFCASLKAKGIKIQQK